MKENRFRKMGFATIHQRNSPKTLAIRLFFSSILAALLFWTLTSETQADGTQSVSFVDGKLYLTKHMDQFVIDAAISDADILSGNYDNQFTAPPNAYLVQDKDNWYRFTIKNEGSNAGEWILALDSAMVDDAELIYMQDGTVYKQLTGLRYPHASRPVPYNMFAFPIQQAAGVTKTYYLKVKTPFQIYFSPTITDYPNFLKDVAVNFSFPHLFIGLLMGVFVYLLVLSFGTVSELTVHRFVWFVLFAVLIIMYVDGFLMAYLPNNNEWLVTRLWLLLHIGLQISYLRATQGFFRTKENYPYIDVYLNTCIVSAIILLLLLFLIPYSLLVKFELWNAAQMILIMTALSVYIWACERRKVTLFVIGNIGMLFMAAISTFAALSSLTASDWLVKHGFELGFCWQAIFFTWALSQKINELATATIAAKADSNAKSEFIAKMSHEIRTPMNGVLGMTQLLRTTPINNEQKHYLNVIESSGKTLLAVINDILDYSKLMAGKTELVPSHFNLEQMLAELNTLFGDIAHSKNISFNIIITPDTPVNLYGDDVRLRQVLTNLLSNAFKFTDRGLVILKVKSSSTSEKNVTLRFSVQDTGIGVNPADQKNLFKNFTQVESHAARRYGGTGLGLSICKQFVEMMGGDISVNSGANEGAEFVFTVDMQISSTIEPTPNPDGKLITKSSVQQLKILVAEDDAINRDVLSGFLKKAAWDADFVFNGKEAVDKIEKSNGHYNLILMDCEMPVIDGITACKSIRKIEKKSGKKSIPIVALTAHTSNSYLKRCTDAGMTECLCKPISYDQLHNIIVRLTS